MNLVDVTKWIFIAIGGVVVIAFIIWMIVSFFKRKVALVENGGKKEKVGTATCAALNCGVWFNKLKHKSKYCDFHGEVLSLNIKLTELESSFRRKSQMYFNQDARSLSGNQQHNIIEELKKHIKDEEKKNSK